MLLKRIEKNLDKNNFTQEKNGQLNSDFNINRKA